MKIKTLVYSIILSAIFSNGFAQKNKVAAADKQYERFAFVDAITTYERIAAKGYKDEKMFQKLGNAYYFNADLPKAAKWYGELFAMNQEQDPEYYYRYSQSLKATGDYAKADAMMEQFNKKLANDQRAKLYASHKNYLEEIKANSGRYTIADAGINSEYSDYGSSYLGNKLVFTSARDTGFIFKKVFRWNNQSFTNLYESDINSDNTLSKPQKFGKRINSKYHESTPVFTKDGKTMYFTRNNYLDRKKGENNNGVTLLKLYKATLEENQWGNVTELPFNSDQYSVAHPALSSDDRILYFSSDMPGTMGQSDLFRVTIFDDGSYSTPSNLGTTINTEGRETFPFVSGDNELYFASDGHPGLGGLDLFVSKIEKGNGFKDVQNVGAPVNGSKDDFALMMDSKSRNGFFTSNREGGKGYDDIYRFKEDRKLACEQLLTGVITDQETGQLLVSSKVSLFDEKFQLLNGVIADENGQYSFEVVCGETYYVRAEKQDYLTKEGKINIDKSRGKTNFPLALEKQVKLIEKGADLAKTLSMPNIYFDLDQSFITKEATIELEKIVVVMKQYPAMKIDVRSHTDSRQTKKYNQALSNRRANATIDWLVNNGIELSRITGKGFGETQLVNKCSDGVKCSDEEHFANRRSEFIVISME
jgi:outer membrane protein OmpA-like peptidoglycan-associated protein